MNDHSQRAHSDYGGSVISRIALCPGSVRRSRGIVDTPSKYALEGTMAHEVLEALLRVEIGGYDGADIAEATARTAAIPEDDKKDMLAAVDVAVNYVLDLLDTYPDAQIVLEHNFTIPSDVAPSEVFGTCDICIYVPGLLRLYVIDYKHGAGVPVYAKNNKQVREYGVGALFSPELGWRVAEAVLVIIQPRANHPTGPVQEDRIPASELIDFRADIDDIIRASKDPNAPLIPGNEQCFFCPARVDCEARQQLLLTASGFSDVKQVSVEGLPAVGEMSIDRVGHILSVKKGIIKWLEAVEERGAKLAHEGIQVPGQKLVYPIGRRRWEGDPAAIANTLAEITAIPPKEWMELSLLGITEAEAKVKAALKPQGKEAVKSALDRFAFLTTKKSSDKLTLVSEDDSRPAVNPAANAFEGVVALPHITTGA